MPLRLDDDARPWLTDLFSATTSLSMIRDRATTVCIGLQDLDLPALVTLEVIDALLVNGVRMFAKWELITAVRHFHDRRHSKKANKR